LASDLHLPEAVTPTAALNGLSATAGDPQVLFAPDPGASLDVSAFGEQLRDASAVFLLPGFANPPQPPTGASEAGVPQKDASRADWSVPYLPVIPMPATNQITLPLNFALPANRAEEQPVPGAPAQPQVEPAPIAQPAAQAQGTAAADVTTPAVILPSKSISPLINAGGEEPITQPAGPAHNAPPVITQTASTPARASTPQPTKPRLETEPTLQAASVTSNARSLGGTTPSQTVTETAPQAPAVVPSVLQTQPQASVSVPPAPASPPAKVASADTTEAAPTTVPQPATLDRSFTVAAQYEALPGTVAPDRVADRALSGDPVIAGVASHAPQEKESPVNVANSALQGKAPLANVANNTPHGKGPLVNAANVALLSRDRQGAVGQPGVSVSAPPPAAAPATQTQLPAIVSNLDDLTPIPVQPLLPEAGAAPSPRAVATLQPPPQVEATPARSQSVSAIRLPEPPAPKSDPQPVNQPQTNGAPPAIHRSASLEPSAAIAPSGPIQQATQPSVAAPQYKAQPPADAPVPQQPQPQPITIPQVVIAPVAQPVSGELTFAVKVTPQDSASPAVESADSTGVVAPLVAPSAPQVAPVKDSRRAEDDAQLPNGAPQHEAPHETPVPAAAPALMAEKPAAPQAVSIPETHTAPPLHANPPEATQMTATPEAKPPQPLKQLSIQVGQEQQQKVEVRVVERAGELQVAVRAANPDVAQGLRQGLSDLVGQLQQNGFHADAWRPGVTAGTTQATAEKPQTQAGSQNNNSQSQSGGSQPDRQQGNNNPSRRPQWVEELETTSAGSGEQIAGETYGIRR